MAKSVNSNSKTKSQSVGAEALENQNNINGDTTGFNMADVMALMQSMTKQISSLSSELAETKERLEKAENKVENESDKISNEASVQSETVLSSTADKTDRLLEILANKKSDKEVVIVHNRELFGGQSTAIKLTGLTINFHKLGEVRVLSWQQFEECVSKYRRWFDKEIILLDADYAELSQRYSVPCVKRTNNKTITREDLVNLAYLDTRKLEDFYNSLTAEDKSFICSYWLGKCYERDSKFYDRYKVETLNRLSDGVFDNVLAVMNNDFARRN